MIEIVIAIIALVSSVITAGISAVFNRKNEIRLKHFENELAVKRAEQDARRDYEYEARKRLYQECEPILFQFAELSESALRRIYALARNAREGNLGPNSYWLSTDNYFIRSTIYRLLAPMAAFKILQHRLTTIDLELDRSINLQYTLAKNLYYTFSSATDLARSEPSIPYDPDQISPEFINLTESKRIENRTKHPERYWLQGLKVGMLDILTENLILSEGNAITRIKSFGEFEQEFFGKGNHTETSEKNEFEVFITLFSFFHPRTRPVLWRVLIAQAYLYNAIIHVRSDTTKVSSLNIKDFETFKVLLKIDKCKSECNWKQPGEILSDEEFCLPFIAAKNYLHNIWGQV
jgi:hypothetical protein